MHGWHHAPGADHQRHNFGNNFSFFDWIFGTARLEIGMPPRFGTAAADYPHDNLWRQFVYAFRPASSGETRA